MTTFFTLLGIIAFLVIVKFIYDTFLTRNTEKEWEKYKQINPVEAARIEKNTGLDFSTKPKSKDEDKENSLLRLAASFNCSPLEVKLNLFHELNGKERSDKDVIAFIHQLRQRQYNESKEFNIDPSDTSGAILEEWATEFFEKKEHAKPNSSPVKNSGPERIAHEDEISDVGRIIKENAELRKAAQTGNKAAIERLLDENPERLRSLTRNIVHVEEPAEQYRLKAVDKLFEENNPQEAITLINRGLNIHEPQTTPFLYNLRAECYHRLSDNSTALIDINKSIELLIKQSPDNYYTIHSFLKERAEIKRALDNLSGAVQDEKSAQQYYLKYEASKTSDEDDNDLPF